MKERGLKLFGALLCALLLYIPMKASDEALQEWSKRFPEESATIVGTEKHDDLCYVFLFRREAANVFCRIVCRIAPPENTRDELFFLSDGTGIGEVTIEVIVKSQVPDVRLRRTLSKGEVSALFSKIVSHEVFTLGKAQSLEPGLIALDGYSVLLLREFRGRRSIIERTAGTSVPVDSFVSEMWKTIEAEITAQLHSKAIR